MTEFQIRRRAVKNFPVVYPETRESVKSLRRQWVRSVRALGDAWLMRRPVARREVPYGV